jgi:hypothetical protein
MRKKRVKNIKEINSYFFYSLQQAMPFLPFKSRDWVARKYLKTGILEAMKVGKKYGSRYKIKGSDLKRFIKEYNSGRIEIKNYETIHITRNK